MPPLQGGSRDFEILWFYHLWESRGPDLTAWRDKHKWGLSANGNTVALQASITSSILVASTMTICKLCERDYLYDRTKGHRKDTCNTCLVNIRRKQRDEKIYAYKGTSCVRCGYNKCTGALCFHHLDPKEKDFQISGNWGLSWAKVKNELDKCILVCANCHAEIHMES